jgi:hypothetical protein
MISGSGRPSEHRFAITPRLSERIVESLAWCDANSPAFHISATDLVTRRSDCTKRRKSYSKKEGECCIIQGPLQLSLGYAQLFLMTPACFRRPIHRRLVFWSTGLRSSNFWAQLDSLGDSEKMRTGPRDQPVSGLQRFAELPRIMGRAFSAAMGESSRWAGPISTWREEEKKSLAKTRRRQGVLS